MTESTQSIRGSNIFWMLLSGAIFGYFGYFAGMTTTAANGTQVLFFAILLWTLRFGAIAFAFSAAISFISRICGDVAFCLAGLVCAAAFVIVGVMDVFDTQYVAAIPPFLAFIFAAWNGYVSWLGLVDVIAVRASARPMATGQA